MQPLIIKKTKQLDLVACFKEYVIKNLDASYLTDKLKKFFGEVNQNRAVISNMKHTSTNISELKQHANIVNHYINQLNLLKTKMTFGKESYSCKIEFIWCDTIKKSKYESFNIYFEIYNSMFNLASLYYALGFYNSQTENADKETRKLSSKYFKYSMYIFQYLKEEATTKIFKDDLPIDLLPEHLEYCITMCIISGNIEILEIAKETSKNEFSLLSKIALTISENYKKAYDLSNENPTKKGGESDFRNYLLNRSFYYKGLMCKFLKEASKKNFDNCGKGFGEVLFFQGLFVEQLTECEKTIKKCGKLVNVEGFYKEFQTEKESGEEMLDLNNRVYRQEVPDGKDMVFAKKDMMVGILPDDLYINENEKKMKNDSDIYTSELDLLVPIEVKEMINRYKNKMNEVINKNLSNCENEDTINNFIQNLNIPERLKKNNKNNNNVIPKEFPPELWEKISNVQQIGGIMTLTNMMNKIMDKSNFLMKSLENVLNSFGNEDRDDMQCRHRYGEAQWIRQPSTVLNGNYVRGIQQFIEQLRNTNTYDINQNNEILQNAPSFEKLLMTKEQLVNNIPKKEEINVTNANAEAEIKKQIDILYELSEKCMNIINNIYKDLNDEFLIGLFVQVLEKKNTEKAIFENNKEILEKKFEDLKSLSNEVNNQKNIINQACQKYIPGQQNKNMNQETKNYFNDLEKCANLFLNMYDKIKKGNNFYNELKKTIDDAIQRCNNWMLQRAEEKRVLISTIEGRNNGRQNYLNENAYFNSASNPYTNLNVPRYDRQGSFGSPGNQGDHGN